MHIIGYMTISMRHVASDWVIFKDFQPLCLMETAMAPLISKLESLFAYQLIHNDSGNLLSYKPGLQHAYYWIYDHFHEACCQGLGHIQRFSTIMPHGNSYGSFNMHARDIVCISRDSQ